MPPPAAQPAAGRPTPSTAPKPAAAPRRPFHPYFRRSAGSSSSAAPRVKTTAFLLPAATVAATLAQQDALIWLQYFPHDAPGSRGSALDTKLRAMDAFVERHRGLFNFNAIRGAHQCSLPAPALLEDAALLAAWPTVAADLAESPEQTLNCLQHVLHKRLIRMTVAAADSAAPAAAALNACLRRLRVRLDGCGPCVSLRSLKVCNYGRLITFRGTIIRASVAQLACTWLQFRCTGCSAQQIVAQPEGRMTAPTRCPADGCRAQGGFQPMLGAAHTRTEAVQVIRLQESMQGAQFESGRVPRTIELEFGGGLVDSVSPGDEVLVTGVLKVHAAGAGEGGGGGGAGGGGAAGDGGGGRDGASLHRMYVEAVSVACDKNVLKVRRSDFTRQDLEVIARIRGEPDVFRLLVHSLCAGIYGHNMVKAGLILGLFGASGNTSPSSSSTTTSNPSATQKRRTETHILIVGDPGVGKSQMLQAAASISPRGIFVCGNSSSNAGLTVSVRHDKSNGSTLEAGALVLADQGCCCIDEFDKMSANHEALLEVMEEQTVSVAKAGVLCSLPARTCVLAAANPAGGHYDPGRSLMANLRMNPALLSRFDLIFVLLDRPDERTDRLMTAHITAAYTGGTAHPAGSEASGSTQQDASQSAATATLSARLQLRVNERLDALPAVLMQKYIGYARKKCQPRLSAAAAGELRRFYLEQRAQPRGSDCTPVTTRQLEALVRLTQARARVELAEVASAEHALDVLDIVRHSQADVRRGKAAGGGWSAGLSAAACAKVLSAATQAKRLRAALLQMSGACGKTVFSVAEMKECAAGVVGVQAATVTQLVDKLNMGGELLKVGQNLYKLLVD